LEEVEELEKEIAKEKTKKATFAAF